MSSSWISIEHRPILLFLMLFLLYISGVWLFAASLTYNPPTYRAKGVSHVELRYAQPDPRRSSWKVMRTAQGLKHDLPALFFASLHLLLWHWLQVIMYSVVLFAYSNLLDKVQIVAGAMVLLREVSYFFLSVVALFKKPSYLLFSPQRRLKDTGGLSEVIMYIFMPEKWLIDVLSSRAFHGVGANSITEIRRTDLYQSLTAIFDLSSVLAFYLLCMRWRWDRMPLAIGYTITFLSAVFFFIVNGWAFLVFIGFIMICGGSAFLVLYCGGILELVDMVDLISKILH